MTVVQTSLVFGGIPLLVVLLISVAVYGRSTLHQPNRYRPGKPWPYPAAWYVPHPDALVMPGHPGQPDRKAIEGAPVPTRAAGGATGEW